MRQNVSDKELLSAFNAEPEKFAGIFAANPSLAAVLAAGMEFQGYPLGLLERADAGLPEPRLPDPNPLGVYVELADSRPQFPLHKAYLFSVRPTVGTVLDELGTWLRPKEIEELVRSSSFQCDLKQPLDEVQVAFFIDSDDKPRNRRYADPAAPTTQEEDLAAIRYKFSDDLAAILLCARIVGKERLNIPLFPGEAHLKKALERGEVRCSSGSLGCGWDDGDRRLFTKGFMGSAYQGVFALGSPIIIGLGDPVKPAAIDLNRQAC
jgi:hypothetical protein